MWGARGAERVPFNIAPHDVEHEVAEDMERILRWQQ